MMMPTEMRALAKMNATTVAELDAELDGFDDEPTNRDIEVVVGELDSLVEYKRMVKVANVTPCYPALCNKHKHYYSTAQWLLMARELVNQLDGTIKGSTSKKLQLAINDCVWRATDK